MVYLIILLLVAGTARGTRFTRKLQAGTAETNIQSVAEAPTPPPFLQWPQNCYFCPPGKYGATKSMNLGVMYDRPSSQSTYGYINECQDCPKGTFSEIPACGVARSVLMAGVLVQKGPTRELSVRHRLITCRLSNLRFTLAHMFLPSGHRQPLHNRPRPRLLSEHCSPQCGQPSQRRAALAACSSMPPASLALSALTAWCVMVIGRWAPSLTNMATPSALFLS